MSDRSTYCADCGIRLEDDDPPEARQPCSACGSTRRNIHVTATDFALATSFATASVVRRPRSMTVQIGQAHETDIALPITPRKTRPSTSMGYRVTRTYVINESEAIDGVMQIELIADGKSTVWTGPVVHREDGLLHVIMKLIGQEPEDPDR